MLNVACTPDNVILLAEQVLKWDLHGTKLPLTMTQWDSIYAWFIRIGLDCKGLKYYYHSTKFASDVEENKNDLW